MGNWRDSANTARGSVENHLRALSFRRPVPQQAAQKAMSSSFGKDLERGLGGPPRSETIGVESPGRALSPTTAQQYAQRDSEIEGQLARYRHLLGIHRDPALLGDHRLSGNKGIYERVIKAERAYGKQYTTYAILINSALGLQIIFAAALTALGAANGSRNAITALGAINTMCAGFLAYLKGSGLPNRFKYYQDEFSKLRWHIEQRERDFRKGTGKIMDPLEEVAIVEQMFEQIQLDIESSTPDRFLSASKQPSPEGRSQFPSTAGRVISYRASQLEGLRGAAEQVEQRFSDAKHGLEAQALDARRGIENRAAEARYDIEKQAADTVRQVENHIDVTAQDIGQRTQQNVHQAESQINQTSHKVEERAKEAESNMLDIAEKAAEKVLSMLKDRKGPD